MLTAGARILVLDEPTASLGAEDAAILADLIRSFTADGGSVVYISHKLREVLSIANRITVLRRGAVTGHYDHIDGLTVGQLAEDMVGVVDASGRRVLTGDNVVRERGTVTTVCVLDAAAVEPRTTSGTRVERIRPTSLIVHAGEIVGVAGVVGSGQTSLAELLAGMRQPTSGAITRDGGPVGYIPEHRRDHAIAPSMSLADNIVVHAHRKLGRGPFLSRTAVRDYANHIIAAFDVRTPSVSVAISALSGGNQQRAVVGRELDRKPTLVVAHNPFRGLDVRAIADVERSLIRAAEQGAGVVVISSDLEEIMPISSRILVLFDGGIVGEVDPDAPDSFQRLGSLMGGVA